METLFSQTLSPIISEGVQHEWLITRDHSWWLPLTTCIFVCTLNASSRWLYLINLCSNFHITIIDIHFMHYIKKIESNISKYNLKRAMIIRKSSIYFNFVHYILLILVSNTSLENIWICTEIISISHTHFFLFFFVERDFAIVGYLSKKNMQ